MARHFSEGFTAHALNRTFQIVTHSSNASLVFSLTHNFLVYQCGQPPSLMCHPHLLLFFFLWLPGKWMEQDSICFQWDLVICTNNVLEETNKEGKEVLKMQDTVSRTCWASLGNENNLRKVEKRLRECGEKSTWWILQIATVLYSEAPSFWPALQSWLSTCSPLTFHLKQRQIKTSRHLFSDLSSLSFYNHTYTVVSRNIIQLLSDDLKSRLLPAKYTTDMLQLLSVADKQHMDKITQKY